MTMPFVSALLPTRGRAALQPEVINDAIHSFVSQDWPEKELVILNDNPKQKLFCLLPDVRVVNLESSLPSLGSKRNALVELARGDICIQWDDDDYSMPWRMTQAVAMLDGWHYWSPMKWIYWQKGNPPVVDGNGVGHMCSAFRRKSFLGIYPDLTHGEDIAGHDYALRNLRYRLGGIPDPMVSYIYRFGVSVWHLSGQPNMDTAFQATPLGPHGTYELKAETSIDWQEIHRQATEKN
jgi:glycosyltransferase involved in cell wall biosynthesis